ncbi:hypothetical protein JCM33374_g1449 [Metschnikowia sp. JCM 33374]|nr:hypothetical protein JCM33374_g1449 [Metschnikowia sp. JCM 33374]
MDYSHLLTAGAKVQDILAVYTTNFDQIEFTKALDQALPHLWTGSDKTKSAIGNIFCCGVSHFAKLLDAKKEAEHHGPEGSSTAAPFKAPHGDLGSPAQSMEIKRQSPKFFESSFIDADEDGEDITNLNSFQKGLSSPAESFDAIDLSDAADLDASRENVVVEASDITQLASPEETLAGYELTDSQINVAIERIADVITAWFSNISKQAKKFGKDAFSVIFGLPGSEKAPNDSQLYALLCHTKTFIQKAVKLNDLERASSLRKLIIMIHEILHALFVAFTIKSDNANPNDIIVVKGLLFCFFKADLSSTLQSLLDRTTGSRFPVVETTSHTESLSDSSTLPVKPELRLSYETVMKIYGIYSSLANCPLDLILVDRVSLSLDITTPEDTSPNTYTHFIECIDFSDQEKLDAWNTRLVSQLAAIFNYFYGLSPDIIRHSLRHSSFFGWITGNTLSSGSYLAIDTINSVTSFSDIPLNPMDPFIYEVELYENTKRHQISKTGPGSTFAVKSPSYLAITFQIFQLLRNKGFAKELTSQTNGTILLLDIWLCVSSYVHHYQYKSSVNSFGARVSLLLMLKLTSQKSHLLEALRQRKIDENKWKLCHHKHPVIPLDENSPKKDALLYMIDVIQVTLRYNLSKKLDLENAKIALTVLYQILLDLEANPKEELRTYAWNDLYLALIKFMGFVSRSQNEEGVKYVVEEFFSIIQLLLSPVFDGIVEKTTDLFALGYHPAKSINFDLLYVMLQQRDALQPLFDKFVLKKVNFFRVGKTFVNFNEKLASIPNKEIDANDVTKLLNELSLLREESSQLTTINMESFNYAETFKYFDKYRDYEDFDKQQDLIAGFISMFETDWVGYVGRKKN